MRQPGELSTAEATDVARQVAAFGYTAPPFVITCGEPFTRDDLVDIVSAAVGHSLRVAVSPSETSTLKEANLARLKVTGAAATSVSIDRSTTSLYDDFRAACPAFST